MADRAFEKWYMEDSTSESGGTSVDYDEFSLDQQAHIVMLLKRCWAAALAGARLAAEPQADEFLEGLAKKLDQEIGSGWNQESRVEDALRVLRESGLGERLARVPDHPPSPSGYPKPCGLCSGTIESREDLDWHGLGNCVDVCTRCTGSGIDPDSEAHVKSVTKK